MKCYYYAMNRFKCRGHFFSSPCPNHSLYQSTKQREEFAMKHFLRFVLLLFLVSAVAFAKKDPLAEKHAEGSKIVPPSSASPVLYRTAAGYWDTLSCQDATHDQYDDIAAFPGGTIWIGGFAGKSDDFTLRSTNSGAIWVRNPVISFTLGNGYALAARDANIALAATWIGDIYRTTDGGANWAMVYTYGAGNGYFDGIKFTGGDSVLAIGDADASGICVVKSTDAGATWTRFTNLPAGESNPSLQSSATYHQVLDGIGPNVWLTEYIDVGRAPRLLRTTDFGTTWASDTLLLYGGVTNAYRIRSINMVSVNVGWLVPQQTSNVNRGYVHKTTNGGATWSDTIRIDRQKVIVSVKPVPGTNNLLALGYLGNDPKAWWSTDGGGTWADISPTPLGDGADVRNASFLSSSLGYVTGLYRAYKFTPPGANSVERQPGDVPLKYALRQNYPNPFNPSTTIQYSIPQSDRVSLKVFSLLGQEVATLVDEQQAVGSYTVRFDAHNLASGVYFYMLKAGSFVSTKSLLLMK
jgi:photosystem II stability/assembly factor-like uncharacterized protein